jgi:hypothetical protein
MTGEEFTIFLIFTILINIISCLIVILISSKGE